MDFFQSQHVARQKTATLIVYFFLAIILIVVSIYLAVLFILRYAAPTPELLHEKRVFVRLWDPQLFAAVGIGTVFLVSGGSLYKIAALSRGGSAVAELLGGRILHPETTDLAQRRLLNVVEEMAIASGTPVPPVYLLEDERGINAFAAGHTPSDAVITVTNGCMQLLSRDELQGVIGHEFSHILNGDMRLNIRLMGVLFGLLLIALTGWVIFRTTMGGTVRLGARDDDKKGGNPLPLIGLALYILGYVGVFFGSLIKAAVSRQREFLADASSVQFTRNPEGIAGALKKIGALSEGSLIHDPHAEEASHMFFSSALSQVRELFGLLATHPPLEERIRRIDPTFDGDFSKVRLEPPGAEPEAAEVSARPTQAKPLRFNPVQAVAQVGVLGPAQLAYAAALMDSMPQPLLALLREPLGAQAAIFALLIDSDAAVRQVQVEWLNAHALPALVRATRTAFPLAQQLAPEQRLPLVELAVPVLRQMSAGQYRDFVANVDALVAADQRTTLYEFALKRLLLGHLAAQFGQRKPPAVRYTSVGPLVAPTALVLSVL